MLLEIKPKPWLFPQKAHIISIIHSLFLKCFSSKNMGFQPPVLVQGIHSNGNTEQNFSNFQAFRGF